MQWSRRYGAAELKAHFAEEQDMSDRDWGIGSG